MGNTTSETQIEVKQGNIITAEKEQESRWQELQGCYYKKKQK